MRGIEVKNILYYRTLKQDDTPAQWPGEIIRAPTL